MCGISGILSKSSIDLNDKKIIDLIIKLQYRRGPDKSDTKVYDNCILGHNRLKIIDLSDLGSQPMETDKYSIAFNGEIYNYQILKKELIEKNITFISTSDTEVLLKYFDHFGIDETLKKINGMFAICLYDKIESKLYLIRDRLGIKPLYYYHDTNNGKLYFASNLKSIFYSIYQIYNESWNINYESIYKFLLLGGCWEGETIVKNIFKLESASYLEVDNNINIKKIKYWTLKKREDDIYNLLEDSINIRKVSDVPVSILFSGGIDSSVLAYYSEGYKCIHLCNGEKEYAEEISSKLGVDLVYKDADDCNANDMLNILKEYLLFSGEPSMACIIPTLTLDDVKDISTVVLSGNGGDELFYGYHRIPYTNKIKEDDKKIVSNIKNHDFRDDKSNYNYSDEEYQLLLIFRHPQNIKIKNVESYTLDKLKEIAYDFNIDNNINEEAKFRFMELMNYVKNDLNPTLDYASMYHSLEVRLPFLDHRLIERALTLDSNNHLSDISGDYQFCRKKILKDILSNKLDERLYNRKKYGFSLPSKLAKDYNLIMGDEYMNKLINRGIIESVNMDFGVCDRNAYYLKSSCTSLEVWFQLYVDSGIVKL
jgi:asparagine synthase (glutamine-hydrolysing)